jgi:alkylhydroperoxidase/carboxymuconolactone decarboxylase family protein YurZ
MQVFLQMAKAATATDALDTRTTELIALGMSVATRCVPFVADHAKAW